MIEGQLRWTRGVVIPGPDWHLSWDGEASLCGRPLTDNKSPRFTTHLGDGPPTGACPQCLSIIRLEHGIFE